MQIPALAAGDFAVALVAFMAGAYETALLFMRGRRHGHGWAAGTALGAAFYATTTGIQYGLTDAELVVGLVRAQCLGFVLITACLVGFVEDTTGRRLPLSRAVYLPLAVVGVALVLGTDLIVPPEVRALRLGLLDGPMLVPVAAPLTDVFFAGLLLVCGGAIVQLTLGAAHPLERRAYGLAMMIWLATAAADASITLGVIDTAPMYLLEYGFVLVAVSLMGVDVGRYGVLLRASERSRAELDQSFRMLIERLPLMVLVLRDDRTLQANTAAARVLGVDEPQALVGRALVDLLHPDDRATARERLHDIATLATAPALWEARFLRGVNQPVIAEVTAVPVTYGGEPAVALLALDVTDQRLLMARMMGADRMVAVGTLAAGVAHEINNPMTYVVTNLETAQFALQDLLRRSPAADTRTDVGEILSSLEEARDGALRVRRIVRDLTMLSRSEGGQPGPVDLLAVLKSAQSVALSEIRYHARLVFDAGPLPPVVGDASRLGQVFLNLLVNAAQSIPRGDVEGNEIRVRTWTDLAGDAWIEVRDTGSGIQPEHRPRIFDPFFTTKPPGQGTGLGLAMCQGIVLAHGGQIELETTVGAGSAFRVRLPAAPSDSTPAPLTTPRPTTASLRATPTGPRPAVSVTPARRRVLIIDDEARVGESLGRFLGRDFESEAVTSAREALARLREPGRPPYDAILSDLMMPDMTGMEFFEVLRVERPEIAERVIFLTGGAFTQQTRTWMTTLTNPWLEKPPDLRALCEAIDEVAPPPP